MDKLVHQLTCLAPLQGFEAAARHLSFTGAAAELCLSQSAISRQVQMLESQLGVSLFVRKTRQLVLTPEGEKLLLTVQDVLHRLASTVAGFQLSQRRPVTVSTTVGIASLWLVPRLANFLDRHPEIDVRVSANNRLVDIEREGIDLALRYVTVDQRPAHCRLLAGEDIFPVGAPEVLAELAQRVPQEQDIARLTLLNYDDANPDLWLDWSNWLKLLGLSGARPKAMLHFNHYDQAIAAAAAGQGLAIGRGVLIQQLLNSGRLLPMACPYRHRSERSYYLVGADENRRPEVQELSDWIQSEF
jgi:DNA-binding transcriptional LysR family regulator